MTVRESDLRAAEGSSTVATPVEHPGLVQALRVIAPLTSLVVLIQAIFAGQGLFNDTDLITVHGGIGNLTLLLVLIQTGLVLFAGFRGRTRTILLGLNLLLPVLVVVQIALGYAGEDGGQAAAWHVPNGVAIFGLTAGNAAFVSNLRAGTRGE
jgi:hypothetical protein